LWRRLRGIPTPTYVTVAATYKCQCKCEHCYSNSPIRGPGKELTTEQLKAVIRDIAELGALTIHFSGGEPLLRKDIFELVSYTRQLGMLPRVNSNGLLLNEDNVKKLKEAGLSECAVSLDSDTSAVHDHLRHTPRLHKQVLDGIRNLRRFGIPCRIMTLAQREIIPDGLARTIRLGKELGAKFMYILLPIAVGGWDKDYSKVLTAAERSQLRRMQDLSFAHLEMQSDTTNCCIYEKAILYISANGDVTPCAFTPFVLGNITEIPLKKIWEHLCKDIKLVYRGDCPLNNPAEREALSQHVRRVAEELRQ
jgi:MoaA/NifB/PqqE/SkfB family radical SAM enzyme